MVAIEVVNTIADGQRMHNAELDGIMDALNGMGVQVHTADATVLGSNLIITMPALTSVRVPDGSGGFVTVSTSAGDVNVTSNAGNDARTDGMTINTSGTYVMVDGTPTDETGTRAEAPMPDKPVAALLVMKVRMEAGATTVGTDKVWGRAIDISEISPSTYIVKATAETVNNSAVLQDDNDFTFPIDADGEYEFEIVATISSGTTPDFKFDFKTPTTPIDYATFLDVETGTWARTDGGSDNVVAGAGAARTLIITGILREVLGSSAIFTWQWAQNTQTASDTTVLAGSYLRYRKLN